MRRGTLWAAALMLSWALGLAGSPAISASAANRAHTDPAGTPSDPPDALFWLTVSARDGNVQSQETLAVKHYFGDGVPPNYAEAVRWVRLAADGGAPLAKTYFSDVPLDGRGVRSTIEVLRWLRLGASKGNPHAQERLGIKLYLGDGVRQDPEEAARTLLPAAERGLARAQHYLGRMYARGDGAQQDSQRALNWLTRAAEQDCTEAQLELGSMYAQGRGEPAGDEEAVRWLRRAAARNNDPAKALLWAMAEAGRALPESPHDGRDWLRAAAGAGNPAAQRRYGDLWLRREGLPVHLSEYGCFRMAAFWYWQSARQGDAAAQAALARMYLKGMGMDSDPGEALVWASLAAGGGHLDADDLIKASRENLEGTSVEAARKKAEKLRRHLPGTSIVAGTGLPNLEPQASP